MNDVKMNDEVKEYLEIVNKLVKEKIVKDMNGKPMLFEGVWLTPESVNALLKSVTVTF